MMTPIERAARALKLKLAESNRTISYSDAAFFSRTVIESLREPSPAQIVAALDIALVPAGDAAPAWRAMIDAALQETAPEQTHDTD